MPEVLVQVSSQFVLAHKEPLLCPSLQSPSPPPTPFTAASSCSPKMPQSEWQQQHPLGLSTFFHCPHQGASKNPQTSQAPLRIDPIIGPEQSTGGSLPWFPRCSFPLGRLGGKLLLSFHAQNLVGFSPGAVFCRPIRFSRSHITPGREMHRGTEQLCQPGPALPCQGGKGFPPQRNFLQQI